jgi:hypothetical protein
MSSKDLRANLDLSFRPASYGAIEADDGIEIARIDLVGSVNGDIVQVLTHQVESGWQYQMKDTYETAFEVSPISSKEPLSLNELIGLIDTSESDYGTGYVVPVLDMNMENSDEPAESLRDFLKVSSTLYPQLEQHYRERINKWICENPNDDQAGED